MRRIVYPCACFEYAMGNLKKKTLLEIWRKSKLAEKIGRHDYLGECKSCRYYNMCFGGCPGETIVR